MSLIRLYTSASALCQLPLSVRSAQIGLQSEENGPMEWSGRVLLGARGGEIDSPKDPSHKK